MLDGPRRRRIGARRSSPKTPPTKTRVSELLDPSLRHDGGESSARAYARSAPRAGMHPSQRSVSDYFDLVSHILDERRIFRRSGDADDADRVLSDRKRL